MSAKEEYSTTDMGFAAYLCVLGFERGNSYREPRGKQKVHFVFLISEHEADDLLEATRGWTSGKGQVSALQFQTALGELKRAIHLIPLMEQHK